MNERIRHDEMKTTSWLDNALGLTPLYAAAQRSEPGTGTRACAPSIKTSTMSPWLPPGETRMRRGVALLSIAAIVAGTAIVTLPARWMGSGEPTPPAAQMHGDAEGAVHLPVSREHPSSAAQAAQPAPTSSSATGDAAAR